MTDGIRIELDTPALDRAIADRTQRLDDMTPAWRSVGRYLVSRIQLGFRAQQSPYGAPWAPTRRGGQILRMTSRLRDSVTEDPGRDHVAVGTNVGYARVHQFGAVIRAKAAAYLRFRIGDRWARKKQVTIPARPFMPTEGLPEDWTAGAIRAIEGHFRAAR